MYGQNAKETANFIVMFSPTLVRDKEKTYDKRTEETGT